MSKVFLKSSQVEIGNGNVLWANNQPVSHAEFVLAQKEAEFVVRLANEVKGADLVGKKATTLKELADKVNKEMSEKSATTYVKKEDVKKGELTSKLAEEAMAWMNGIASNGKTDKINEAMQQFNIIEEFETIGLFFDSAISPKFNKLYTVAEILKAVTTLVEANA